MNMGPDDYEAKMPATDLKKPEPAPNDLLLADGCTEEEPAPADAAPAQPKTDFVDRRDDPGNVFV